jgi:hypothetical protein
MMVWPGVTRVTAKASLYSLPKYCGHSSERNRTVPRNSADFTSNDWVSDPGTSPWVATMTVLSDAAAAATGSTACPPSALAAGFTAAPVPGTTVTVPVVAQPLTPSVNPALLSPGGTIPASPRSISTPSAGAEATR